MAEGKKHGGYREGSGRKSVVTEEERIAIIKMSLGKDGLKEIWDKIVEQAKEGSKDHITFLFNYYYGRPREHKEIKLEVEKNLPDWLDE